jgi:hypothetical protein
VAASDAVVLKVVGGEQRRRSSGLLRSAGLECGYCDTDALDSQLEDFIAASAQILRTYLRSTTRRQARRRRG